MILIALYELHKLISPNNVGTTRITDYEATMQRLHNTNRRKLDEKKKQVSEIAMVTFQRNYAPIQKFAANIMRVPGTTPTRCEPQP